MHGMGIKKSKTLFTSGVIVFSFGTEHVCIVVPCLSDIPYLTACTSLIANFGYPENLLHTALCHVWGGQLLACHYHDLDTFPHRSKVGYVVHKVAMEQVFLWVCRLSSLYNFTSAPYSFIHQAPTLYDLRNWHLRSVTLLKHKTLT
jgi:hypothetical protein